MMTRDLSSIRGRLHPRRTARHAAGSGQALILIVFIIVALVAITGLAVDGGGAYADRRRAQNAADSSALAGALARLNGQPWVDAAYQVAATNGYDNNGSSNTVVIHSPPINGAYKDNIEYIQVDITSHVRTYFASVIGMDQITNKVEAMARSKPSILGPMFGGAAVVSLAPTSDCLNHKSFYVHAEGTLNITGGDILINSNNPTCALIQQGEGSLRITDDHQIRVVGGLDIQKPKLLTPYPPISTSPMQYPPPLYMPKIYCGQKESTQSDDGGTMTSGNWGFDDFPPPGVTALESGLYCLEGDFKLTDGRQIIGGNVVIYMKRGQIRLSGNSQIDLSAPHKGYYAGLLFYQPIENKNPVILNAEAESAFRGAILAPGALIKIKGNDSKFGFHSQIIGYAIEVDGDSGVIIKYADDDNMDLLTLPRVEFVK